MTANHITPVANSSLPTNSPRTGSVRFDSTNNRVVVWNGTSWVPQDLFHVHVTCVGNADVVDKAFFIANRACKVIAISEVHSTAGSDASAVNVQVVKDTGTAAPGAGTDLLTNNTNAGFNMKGTANTVQNGTLVASSASLTLAAGDRLSLDFAGTVTAVAGVVVSITLEYLA